MNTFAELIEDIKTLSTEELEELNHITSKYISERNRDSLLKSHEGSVQEYEEGKLIFSSDVKISDF